MACPKGDFQRPDFMEEWNKTLVGAVKTLEWKIRGYLASLRDSDPDNRRRRMLHMHKMTGMADIELDIFAPWLAP
eukprot:1831289-Rhodomonas_salina.1